MPRSAFSRFFLPAGTQPDAGVLLWTRGARAFGDGFMSLLLPFYLKLLGFSAFDVGLIVTATLLGSGIMTLAIGMIAHRYRSRSLLLAASLLMAATGVAVVFATDFWPLLVVAFVGTLNPSAGDVSVFSPLEQSLLARVASARSRTALFARYSLVGALIGALGAQAASAPILATHLFGLDIKTALQGMFVLYAALGAACLPLYRGLSPQIDVHEEAHQPAPLGKSKKIIYTLAALFSIDSFAGGFDGTAHAAEQIQLPRRIEAGLVSGHGGALVGEARLLAAAACVVHAGIDRRQLIGLGAAEQRPRFMQSRHRDAQVEVVRRGTLDQRIQRGVVELLPPRGLELRIVFLRRVETLHLRRGNLSRVVLRAHAGAAGQYQDGCQSRAERGGLQ